MAEQPARSITQWLAEVHDPDKVQQAWDRLAERLYPVSASKARRKGLNEADASSIGQQSLLKLFRRLTSGQVVVTRRAQLFGLFARIAAHTAVDRLRRNEKLDINSELFTGDADLSDDTIPRWLEAAEPTLEEEEQSNLLERRFLAALSDQQRDVYELRVEQELEVPEIAARLGVSKESVYRRLDEMADVVRAVSDESELAWLRAEQAGDAVGPLIAEMQELLDVPGREALTRWLTGADGPEIAKALETTPTRGYAMLSHLDDVVYVLRKKRQLNDLRTRIRAADDTSLHDELKEIIKKRRWPVFEAWLAGKDASQLVAEWPGKSREIFAALRATHESARAIRRAL